jgi:hypothetical protein
MARYRDSPWVRVRLAIYGSGRRLDSSESREYETEVGEAVNRIRTDTGDRKQGAIAQAVGKR